jgi:hypothetical protein
MVRLSFSTDSKMVLLRLLRVHHNLHNARIPIQVSAVTGHMQTSSYRSGRFDRQQGTPLFTESRLLRLALVFAASTLTAGSSVTPVTPVTACQSLNRRRAKWTPSATCLLRGLRGTAVGRSSTALHILLVYIEVALSGDVLSTTDVLCAFNNITECCRN